MRRCLAHYFSIFGVLSLPIVVLLLALARPIYAQEFDPHHVVFPITNFIPDITYVAPLHAFTGPVVTAFGTGFCLDPNCRFVGTTYHVAKAMGSSQVLIKRVFSVHRYLDSSPDDEGAEDVKFAKDSFPFVIGGSMRLNPAHDLAIYQMEHPLKHFHGIGFEAYQDLENSPEVDIYGYPFHWNPKRGLVSWHGKFLGKDRHGLLVFSYEEGRVHGGTSGGIVVDSKTKKIVGIVNEVKEGDDRVVFAVPVSELSAFVGRTQPYLQTMLFPKTVFVSPMAADLYPAYVWTPTNSFSKRLPEAPEVVRLRQTAQHLANSMRNFTATETFAWGRDNREPDLTEAYETFILNGWQRWRRPRDGKWFYEDSPMPHFWLSYSIGTGDQWIRLPRMVGTELDLRIHQAPDAVVGGRTVHVFQYAAKAEDEACPMRYFGAYQITTRYYDCHGEVWMDESGTILRISESIDNSRPLRRFWGVVTYGRLEKEGKEYLVPITFATQAENDKTYWCRGLFTDYGIFNARARLLPPLQAQIDAN